MSFYIPKPRSFIDWCRVLYQIDPARLWHGYWCSNFQSIYWQPIVIIIYTVYNMYTAFCKNSVATKYISISVYHYIPVWVPHARTLPVHAFQDGWLYKRGLESHEYDTVYTQTLFSHSFDSINLRVYSDIVIYWYTWSRQNFCKTL